MIAAVVVHDREERKSVCAAVHRTPGAVHEAPSDWIETEKRPRSRWQEPLP
jgi:hypothetical protein